MSNAEQESAVAELTRTAQEQGFYDDPPGPRLICGAKGHKPFESPIRLAMWACRKDHCPHCLGHV